jgi:hypothetical protein
MSVMSPHPSGAPRDAPSARRRPNWPLIGGLTLLAVVLLPAVHASLRGDDGWNSEKQGLLELKDTSLVGLIWGYVKDFVGTQGRPQPLGVIQGETTIWLFDDHLVLYRLCLIALTVLGAWLLYRLARRLGLGSASALLVLVLLAGAIQFRQSHDPMLGYYGTTQVVLVLLLGSLLAFDRYLQEGGARLLWMSIALFVLCPLLYESAYPLAGVHLALALMRRHGRAAVRAALPFLAVGVGFLLLSFVLRKLAPEVSAGYEVSFRPWSTLRSYVVQLLPPLPTSSVALDPAPQLADPTKPELAGAAWRGLAVLVLVAGCLLQLARDRGARLPSEATVRRVLVAGAALWLTAPALIATALKYQETLTPGRGYLPVLIQVFGYALVACATLLVLLRAAVGRSVAAVRFTVAAAACLFGFGAGVVGYANLRVVALEQPAKHTRELLERAATNGTFGGLPERSTLLFGFRDMNWPGGWRFGESPLESMLLDHTGRRFDGRIVLPAPSVECPDHGLFPPPDCAPLGSHQAWVHVRARRGGGIVIVARMRAGAAADAGGAPARELWVYVADASADTPRPARLIGSSPAGPWASGDLRWRRDRAGRHWAIYRASVPAGSRPTAASLDDARADAVDFSVRLPAPEVARKFGTQGLLP